MYIIYLFSEGVAQVEKYEPLINIWQENIIQSKIPVFVEAK